MQLDMGYANMKTFIEQKCEDIVTLRMLKSMLGGMILVMRDPQQKELFETLEALVQLHITRNEIHDEKLSRTSN